MNDLPILSATFRDFFRIVGKKGQYSGYFQIVSIPKKPLVEDPPAQVVSEEATIFIKYINSKLNNLSGYSTNLSLARHRDNCAKQLRDVADRFLNKSRLTQDLIVDAAHHLGQFDATRSAILDPADTVKVKHKKGLAYSLSFDLTRRKLLDSQQALFREIDKAQTVVSVVLAVQPHSWTFPLKKFVNSYKDPLRRRKLTSLESTNKYFNRQDAAVRITPAQRRRSEYVKTLERIAYQGLVSDQVEYALLALEGFKEDFTTMEADAVKNDYIKLLGFHCLFWASLFTIVLITLSTFSSPVVFFGYITAAIGACGGTWLSFSMRRVLLRFEDLTLLEEDRLKPTARILFVVGLTWIIGMLLDLDFVPIVINDVKLQFNGALSGDYWSSLASVYSPLKALLIGALCGVSERALSGVVSRRAAGFVSGLGARDLEHRKREDEQ